MEHETAPAKTPDALPVSTPAVRESRPVSLTRSLIEHALSFGLAGPPIAGFFILLGASVMIALGNGIEAAVSALSELTSFLFIGSYYVGAIPAALTGIITVIVSRSLGSGPRLYAVTALIGWAISSATVYIILAGPDMVSPNAVVIFMIGGSAAIATLICTRLTRNLRPRATSNPV